MKFTLLLLSLPLFALASPTLASADAPACNETEIPTTGQRYNVILDDDDPRTLDEVITEMGLNRSDLYYTFENSAFRGFSADLHEDFVGMLSDTSGFAVFEPDVKMQIAGSSKGPWGLKRISQRGKVDLGGKSVKDLIESYKYKGDAAKLGKGVDIYILDSGVKVDHKDFGKRAKFVFTFDGKEIDDEGHGTHAAGIAGSKTYGVAKGANIIAMRVASGKSNTIDTSDIVKGISEMVVNHSSRKKNKNFSGSVASLSFGGGSSEAIEKALSGASSANIHIAVAAGNSNKDACGTSPARMSKISNIVTVGAMNVADRRWSNQNEGSNFGSCVSLYAPGEDVPSLGTASRGATRVMSGTSMACPHIAGLMAVFLLEDQNLKFDPTKMKEKIIGLAEKIRLEGQDDNKPGDPGIVAYNGQ